MERKIKWYRIKPQGISYFEVAQKRRGPHRNQHAYVAVWPRGAEKCVVADGGWSVESWGHSDFLMVTMQG